MTTNQADDFIGIVTYDPADKNDPLFELRIQSKIAAAQQLVEGVPFSAAAEIVWERMRDLFGAKASSTEGIVRSSVFLLYIDNGALQNVPPYLKELIRLFNEKGTDAHVAEFSKIIKGMEEVEARALLAEIIKVTKGL